MTLFTCHRDMGPALRASQALFGSSSSRLSEKSRLPEKPRLPQKLLLPKIRAQSPPLRTRSGVQSSANSQPATWTSDTSNSSMNVQGGINSLAPTGSFMSYSQQLTPFDLRQSALQPSQASQTPAQTVGSSASYNVPAVLEPSFASVMSVVDRTYASQFALDPFGNPRNNPAM